MEEADIDDDGPQVLYMIFCNLPILFLLLPSCQPQTESNATTAQNPDDLDIHRLEQIYTLCCHFLLHCAEI